MSFQTRRPVLECQDCGDELRDLTPARAREVAARPYDFVAYCARCKRARAGAGTMPG